MDLFLHYLTLPYLIQGIVLTLSATGIGLAGGVVVGLVLAAMQLSRFRPLAMLARGYAVIFRGTPLILQMVFFYDALPYAGIRLPGLLAAGAALAFNEATFIAEIFRSGVLGVDRGQVTAAQALGMAPGVVMRRVIAPQALRSMIPALGNEAVATLKNSSLASVIAVQELTLRSTQLASATFDFFSIFIASGLMYLVLTGLLALIQVLLERRFDLDRQRVPVGHISAVDVRQDSPLEQPPVEANDAPRPLADRSGGLRRLEAAPVAVRVSGLSKAYGGHAVLADLDLVVTSGEVVALLGPSGSGKSTLLRCINHLESWDGGHVHVGGRRLGYKSDGQLMGPRDLALERVQVGVGMVFQQFNLFAHLSAHENIAGPLRWVHGWSEADARARASELLARVGLAHRADALPRHLSGGQQQRVAIARAIAARPKVLLLDEPTSALDPELVQEVLEVIRALSQEEGLAMIISTHQLSFAAEVADRLVFLSGGKILESGTPDQVLRHPRHPQTARFLKVMAA
jgi:polar amino acid transport system permease protein